MKKYLLILSSVLFFFSSFNKTQAQDIVVNGANTKPINFPAGPCVYNWVNNNTSIGLAANGTGNIPSFIAVNTGSSPVTATIIATPLPSSGFAYITNVANNTLSVINLNTGVTVAAIPVGVFPAAVTISPDGTRVYVGNVTSNSVSVINTATNSLITTIPLASSPGLMAISPDGSRIYVTHQTPAGVSVISTVTNSVISAFAIPGNDPLGILISPDGSKAYVTVTPGAVLVFSTSINNTIPSITVGTDPIDFAQSPDGKLLYVSNYMDGTISVINTLTNIVVATIPCGSHPYGITISHDGSKLYVANLSATIAIINTASNSVENTIGIAYQPYGLDLSPDGSLLYVEPENGSNMAVINTLNNTIAANIPVSSPFSFGHFIGNGCDGMPVTFTITVNPASEASVITAGSATGAITACAGTASASPNIQQFTVSGNRLTGDITATAPVGFEVSVASGSGYGSNVIISQTSGAVNNTVVYVRSAAIASVGGISGNVTLKSAGAGNQTVAVTGNIFPLPVVKGGGNKTIAKGSSVAFTATTSANVTDITWSPSAGLDNNKILNPQASPVSTTLYTITVQTAQGCMATDTVTVTVLDGISIPNTFTPNGDGVNDKWDIQNLKDYQNCVVRIFDRYGGEVYSSKGYYNAWDGTINSRRLPVGTYYYLINLNDGTRPLSGFVALIR